MADIFDEYLANPGYTITSNDVCLDVVLTFKNQTEQTLELPVALIVAAFLDLANAGLMPDLPGNWIGQVTNACQDLAPQPALYDGIVLNPEVCCDLCGSEAHAQFKRSDACYYIERWAIVSSVILLIEQHLLPKLPFDWHVALEQHYERIRETGRHHFAKCESGFGRV